MKVNERYIRIKRNKVMLTKIIEQIKNLKNTMKKENECDLHEYQPHVVQSFNGFGIVFKGSPVRLCGFESGCDTSYM